jgi:hypothetical protein
VLPPGENLVTIDRSAPSTPSDSPLLHAGLNDRLTLRPREAARALSVSERTLRSLSKWALAFLLSSILPQTGCHQNYRAPELFAPDCAEQTRGWTTEEIADIAFKAATGRLDRDGATVRIWQTGCKICVAVNWNLRYPGGHFAVFVSAIDGTVLEVLPGQ